MANSARKSRFALPKEIRLLLSAGILVFIFEYVVVPQFASARKSVHLLSHLNPILVIIAVLCEAGALLTYMELTRTVLTPHAPSRFDTLRVNLSGLALGHVTPGGSAPAGVLQYRLLNEMKVPPATNAFGLAVQGSGSAVVLNMMFWMALVISIPLNGFNPLYGFAALAGVFLLLAFFGTIFLLIRGQRHADSWIRTAANRLPWVKPEQVSRLLNTVADRITLLFSNKRTLWASLGWASANWLLDAACLWVFLWAFGHPISPIDLIVAYGIANILAVIPVTPGGLGIIEGVLIPTLVGFGVPHSPAILAVLAYRLVNFWIPIPVGGVAYLTIKWGWPRIKPITE
jgi:hypothetical protein